MALRPGGRGGGVRKERTWARVGFGPTDLANGASLAIDMLADYTTAVGRTVGDITVARIIGRLVVQNQSVGADLTIGGRVAAGIIIVSDQAFAAGVGSMPDPDNAQLAADWLWVDELPILVAPAESAGLYLAVDFDVRGMRKMAGYNKRLVFITTGVTVVSHHWFTARVLLLGEP